MDRRHIARYTVGEAARYLPGLSPTTLRSWVRGRSYPRADGQGFSPPLIRVPDPEDGRLSFTNLVEAHILYGLRTHRRFPMSEIRAALDYAEREFEIDHLLARKDLLASPGNLFLERYGQLVNLGKGGQLGLRKVLEAYLERVVYDDQGWPKLLFPLVPFAPDRDFEINPEISFGQPILVKNGIRVATVADRFEGGETVDTLARDYGLETTEVEKAITYARAA